MVYGINLDTDLKEMGEPLARLLRSRGVKYVTVDESSGIHDRSWEMSAAKAVMSKQSVFATGTVESFDGSNVKYGKIHGLDKKQKKYNNLALMSA